MKNPFYFLAIVLVCVWGKVIPVQAQRPIGDTIRTIEPTFVYRSFNNWYSSDTGGWQSHSGHFLQNDVHNIMVAGNYIRGVEYRIEQPVKIIGIAAAGFMQHWGDTTISSYMNIYYQCLLNEMWREYYSDYFFLNTLDTSISKRATDSLILYKPTTGDPQKLAVAPWRVEDPHRYIVLPPHLQDWLQGHTQSYDGFVIDSAPCVALYEALFDRPVVVEDSFIVAGTGLNNTISRVTRSVNGITEAIWLWDRCPTRYWWVRSPDLEERDTNCILWGKWQTLPQNAREESKDNEWFRLIFSYSYNALIDSIWQETGVYYSLAPVIFPIIDPDFDTTFCHQVQNVRVEASTDTTATLAWTSQEDGPWEVAYGKTTDPWENYTILSVSSPTALLTGLTVGTTYFALVRSYCDHTHEFGEWSPVTEVEVYEHHGPTGIAQPGDLDRFTQLMPNPAHGQVNVLSSYGLTRVVLYDLQGRQVWAQEADGISAMLDVSHIPVGTYVAALHTKGGIATKRLVIER